ncbi:primary-amine oxidase [Bradyrhizobium sp. SZCCHNRI1003]|uniref:primary-amine oxidase n=1 Tax=Bradyrhizobium sp. SZCCHNRI1003 TaxID=3057275 RepID=UPI002915F98C|nr:primary-amine oxidase [Bradyrhizobium sp. SZCCHNRI1003]
MSTKAETLGSILDRREHPLDPLSIAEIRAASSIVRAEYDLGEGSRFETIELDEPSPSELSIYDEGSPLDRRAFVVNYDARTGDLFEITVSLVSRRVLGRRMRPGARPRISEEEMTVADQMICRDPHFVAALAKRGITDLSLVCTDVWSCSVLGDPLEKERRLVNAFVWLRNRPYDNQYARPVEGLTALVDIDRWEVVRVTDEGVGTLTREEENYAARFQKQWRTDLRPMELVQPQGPSFSVDGNLVSWCGWQFRVGFTAREGLVLHDVRIRDGNAWRRVIRRAALAEMMVPYGSPMGAHPRKNAFDCGEYGIGALANSLTNGCDCFGVIRYFDAIINRMDGDARVIKNAICMHEEDAGILWKHFDFRTSSVDVRRNRRLIISFIATVGNYEYAFYWNLFLDGSIELEVKLTGIINTSGVEPNVDDPHGTLVAPGVVGHIHQHLFNVRLDMEVDQPENTVIEVDTERDAPGAGNPHGNAIRLKQTPIERSMDGCRNVDPQRWRFWTIVNRKRRNRVGQPVGYRLVPHSSVRPIGLEGSQVATRGGFTAHDLWVTPTSADRRWPAGDYVNQSGPNEGLPQWVKSNDPVADTRITVWHTFGHHHIPRPEDFPVQPAVSCGFKLQPFGFFDRNPTLDVPAPKPAGSCCGA